MILDSLSCAACAESVECGGENERSSCCSRSQRQCGHTAEYLQAVREPVVQGMAARSYLRLDCLALRWGDILDASSDGAG